MEHRGIGGRRGMTLLEVLLALIVFVVASGGILGSYLASHWLAEHSTDTLRAIGDLEDLAERIYATDFENLPTTFPDGVPNGGGANPYSATVGGYSLQDEQITVTYPTQSPNRVEMLVTINWTFRGLARTARLSILRTES